MELKAIALLCRSLGRRDELAAGDRNLLASLPKGVRTYRREAEIVPQFSRPTSSRLLASGLAARAHTLSDGRRQLTALHVPGDFVDLHGFLIKTMDHSVVALTECVIVGVNHGDLEQITETRPHLTRMLWLSTTIDAAIQREMITSIGRRTPLQRLAHMICELHIRLDVVGLADEHGFEFALSQTHLADLLGLSVVHTNRTVQDLRATKLVSWTKARVTIADFEALAKLAQFDSTYLSLTAEPR